MSKKKISGGRKKTPKNKQTKMFSFFLFSQMRYAVVQNKSLNNFKFLFIERYEDIIHILEVVARKNNTC